MKYALDKTIVALVLLAACLTTKADEPQSPLSTGNALKSFQLANPELTIELVAAEPDVIDPVACAWDADGRLYVVEMHDYPVGPPSGRIKQLVDRDGDGRYEQVTVFAEGLTFPNGVLPWRDGILVTAAPDILFLADHDGDGRADERRTVLTGFAEGNQQLRVNGLIWGLDGWVYGANGRSDGTIRRPDDPPEKAVSLSRHDFRFRPDTGEVETVAGFSQFGLARDDWGNRFLSWNTVPMRHVVLEDSDLARNPFLLAGPTVAQIIDPSGGSRVFPISRSPQTFNRESVQHFNASCGLTIFRGSALPEPYYGNALVCEPLTNLVHRRVLKPNGVTFNAARDATEADREFLASTDPWFRPVNLTTGPDGALYVVDFYRKWVEHPQFVPTDLRDSVDYREGDDLGRIWRVRAPSAVLQSPGKLNLSKATTAELVALLDHPSAWQRDTAQRLLVERRDPAAIPLLEKSCGKGATPQARVLALSTLDILGQLLTDRLLVAVSDESPWIRETAARLGRSRLNDCPQLRAAIRALANDEEPRVRFRAALSLDAEVDVAPLTEILVRDAIDPWARLAVLSSAKDHEPDLIDAIARFDDSILLKSHLYEVLIELGSAFAVRERGAALQAFWSQGESIRNSRVPFLSVVAGMAEGLTQSGENLDAELAKGDLRRQYATAFELAIVVVSTPRYSVDFRKRIARLLGYAATPESSELVLKLLDPDQPVDLQTVAAQSIGRLANRGVAQRALAGWPTMSISARRELLTAMASKPMLAELVATALEEDHIAATDVDFSARDALLQSLDTDLRARFVQRLQSSGASDRSAIVKQFQAALAEPGDAKRGAAMFVRNCVACHSVQGRGARVGPELSGIGARPPSALVYDILDPNRDVAPDFVSYLAVTTDGEIKTGLIANDGPTAITLRQVEGTETVVLRNRLERLQSTGKSLMPEGFEQQMTVAQFADLLAFLAHPDAGLIPANP